MTPDDLSYYWEGAREWCGDNTWNEQKKCCKGIFLIICQSLGNTHGTISSRHGRDTPDIMY